MREDLQDASAPCFQRKHSACHPLVVPHGRLQSVLLCRSHFTMKPAKTCKSLAAGTPLAAVLARLQHILSSWSAMIMLFPLLQRHLARFLNVWLFFLPFALYPVVSSQAIAYPHAILPQMPKLFTSIADRLGGVWDLVMTSTPEQETESALCCMASTLQSTQSVSACNIRFGPLCVPHPAGRS